MGGHSLASDSSPLHPWDRGEGGTLHMNYPTLLGGISLPQDYSPLLSDGGVHLIPRVENYTKDYTHPPDICLVAMTHSEV